MLSLAAVETAFGAFPGTAESCCLDGVLVLLAAALSLLKADASGRCNFDRSMGNTCKLVSFR